MKSSTQINKIKALLLRVLINDGGSFTFASLLAEVGVKQLKTNNPFRDAEITKMTEYNIMLNGNYGNLVRNKRYREAIAKGMSETQAKEFANEFVPAESWFEKENDTFNGSIVHKKSDPEEKYLFFAVNQNNGCKTHNYFVNGVPATDEEVQIIKSFVPATKEGTAQGLEEPIVVRTVKIGGIRKVVTNRVESAF